jgi:hypothetical protein
MDQASASMLLRLRLLIVTNFDPVSNRRKVIKGLKLLAEDIEG